MAKHKLPHDLKDDEFVDTLISVKDFYESNKNFINIAAVSILVVVFAFFFIKNQSEKRKSQAVEALGQVEMAYYQNQFEQAVQLGEELLRKYNDTDEGGNCVILLGNAYYHMEDYEKAESFYQKYINEYNDKDLYSVAAYEGLGNVYSQKNEFVKAAEEYMKASQVNKDFYAIPFLLNKAGDAYRFGGQSDKANEIYKRIIDDYPEYPQMALVKSFYQE